MKNWRRHEILLPLRFNDGKRIPKALLAQTVLKLETRFGAVSCEMQVIQGRWHSGGRAFRDDLTRVYVDADLGSVVSLEETGTVTSACGLESRTTENTAYPPF